MRTIVKFSLKTYGKLLAFFLSLLGFSAIQSSCTKYGPPCNTIRPKITGSVVSENDLPIPGIRAVLKDDHQGYDTAYTAKNGDFFLQYPQDICKEEIMNLLVELQDIDENDSLENQEILVSPDSVQNLGIIKMSHKK